MTLEAKDIIQIDATVITGILILLTISFTDQYETEQSESMEASIKHLESVKIGLTVSIIVPFTISAYLAIKEVEKTKTTPNFGWSITWMKIGFSYIIIGIVVIAVERILLIYS